MVRSVTHAVPEHQRLIVFRREMLNETTGRWGVKVTNIEIKELAMASGVKGAA